MGEVRVEAKQQNSGLLRGHTPNYLEVEFAGPQSLVGEICKVTVNAADETVASGELAAQGSDRARMIPLNVVN